MADDRPPRTSDDPTAAGARATQDPAAAAGARATQDPAAAAGARATQDPAAAAGARAMQDLAALERYPLSLVGRFPRLAPKPEGPDAPAPKRRREERPDLLLLSRGGATRLR